MLAELRGGISGTARTRWHIVLAVVATLVVAASCAASSSPPPTSSPKIDPGLLGEARTTPSLQVIVREARPDTPDAERAVRSLGGTVVHELPLIRSFSVRIPGKALPSLLGFDSVSHVWRDGEIHMSDVDMSQYDGMAPNEAWDDTIQLHKLDTKRYNGSGVTVAVLDTGIIESPDFGSRILAKVDITPDHDGIDHYGHGTHMAGIIAGDGTQSAGKYAGVAPKANLVSVKVASTDGSTDVSAVIAGLQWIYANRAQYNIRVVNVSFGTDSKQSYLVDPLDYAVEQLWFSGVFVVVAAGNRGPTAGTINKPGDDPYVVTVGADDSTSAERSDDVAATFSSTGPTQDGFTKPDVLAPGTSVVSLRAPGSAIDETHPLARVGTAYFKGTGTSQAAAVVSGVAALLFQSKPTLTPDVAKNVLTQAAYKGIGSMKRAGKGLADAKAANDTVLAGGTQAGNLGLIPSSGTGSIEASRGSLHTYADLPTDGLGTADLDGKLDLVVGEIDAMGNSWGSLGWSTLAPNNLGWSNLGWSASAWTNSGWSDLGWSSSGWSGTGWSDLGWSDLGWSDLGWSDLGWSDLGWS